MNIDTDAIVCALRNHGEHGGVVRLFTPEHGLVAAYVRGARGRRMGPVLIPGNLVRAQLRSRTESQLPQAQIELSRSRAAMLTEPLAVAAVEWIAILLASTLPERQPYPGLFDAVDGLFGALDSAPAAKSWAAGLVRVELLFLAELGYGRRLAGLPEPVLAGSSAGWNDVAAALEISGRLLEREILAGRPAALLDSRARLMARIKRAAGTALPASSGRRTSNS